MKAVRIGILVVFELQAACGRRNEAPSASSSARDSAATAAADWTRFAVPSASFQASFPAAPELQDSMTGAFPTHTAMVKRADRIYLLSSLSIPLASRSASTFGSFAAGAPDTMTASFAQRITSVSCTHGDSHKLTVGTLPAVEFLVTCGPTASSRVRLVDGGDHIFQLVVSGSPATVSDTIAERFLSSLQPLE